MKMNFFCKLSVLSRIIRVSTNAHTSKKSRTHPSHPSSSARPTKPRGMPRKKIKIESFSDVSVRHCYPRVNFKIKSKSFWSSWLGNTVFPILLYFAATYMVTCSCGALSQHSQDDGKDAIHYHTTHGHGNF